MRLAMWLTLLTVPFSLGCGAQEADPRAQWRVEISSDVPIPQFADRLLVEVFDENGVACSACRRQFSLRSDGSLPLSFGVRVPADGATRRIRARAYRGIRTGSDGSPLPEGVLDGQGELPPAGEGITNVALPLSMSCYGVAGDVEARQTCDPQSGALAAEPVLSQDLATLPEPGSWPPAQEVPCPASADADMICVPGSAFLLGGDGVLIASDAYIPLPEQVVQVSPFALDTDEVTVGTVRKLVRDGAISYEPALHDPDEEAFQFMCTYRGPGDEHAASDALPVNCVGPPLAAAACEALGKRLPTEAEWELAAGNRTRENRFPWGEDDIDVCDQAIIGRGRNVIEVNIDGAYYESDDCRLPGDAIGPEAAGDEDDVTALGLRNMAGNVSEIVQDRFTPFYSDECWNGGARLFVDPVCSAPVDNAVVKGGSWADSPSRAIVTGRSSQSAWELPTTNGFRCARSF